MIPRPWCCRKAAAAAVFMAWLEGKLKSLPQAPPIQPGVFTVVLDRLQDAGNVGSILRSAAAFGARQVLALKGTAALWSPKVLRAGMGAHFALSLVESLSVDDLAALAVPLLASFAWQPNPNAERAADAVQPRLWAQLVEKKWPAWKKSYPSKKIGL